MRCPNCPHAGGTLKECCGNSRTAFWANVWEHAAGLLMLVTCPVWIPLMWFDDWRTLRRWNKE